MEEKGQMETDGDPLGLHAMEMVGVLTNGFTRVMRIKPDQSTSRKKVGAEWRG
jgi:hypothetical protein